MKFSPITLSALVFSFLLSWVPARADLIPWMYSWSGSPSVVSADVPGTSTITLTDEPLREAIGNSDIVATNLRTKSSASPTHPDTFTHANYTLDLLLLDLDSGKSGTLVFTGYLSGSLSSQNSQINNTFTGQTAQTIRLGDHLFTAEMNAYTPPGNPGESNSGSLGGRVTITIQTLPEPSTLALSGVGLILLGVARWRRNRRAAQQQQELE
jgi:hypothetical protein